MWLLGSLSAPWGGEGEIPKRSSQQQPGEGGREAQIAQLDWRVVEGRPQGQQPQRRREHAAQQQPSRVPRQEAPSARDHHGQPERRRSQRGLDAGARRSVHVERQAAEQARDRVLGQSHQAQAEPERRELPVPAAALGEEEPQIGGQEGDKTKPGRNPQRRPSPARGEQPEQRRRALERAQIVGQRRRAEQQAAAQRRPPPSPARGAQHQEHAEQGQRLGKRETARHHPRVGEAVAPGGQQHGQFRWDRGLPRDRAHRDQGRQGAQHRQQAHREQAIAHDTPPGRERPEIERRMHVGLAQRPRDRHRAGMGREGRPRVPTRNTVAGQAGRGTGEVTKTLYASSYSKLRVAAAAPSASAASDRTASC